MKPIKEFNPKSTSPTPWKVNEKLMWHSVVAANGKTVCNCRNILDARLIVKMANMSEGEQLGNEGSAKSVCGGIREHHHFITTVEQKLVCKHCGEPYMR